MENKINRTPVPVNEVQKAIDEFTNKLKYRLKEKGPGTSPLVTKFKELSMKNGQKPLWP